MKTEPPSFDNLYQIETCRAASGCPNANIDAGSLIDAIEKTFKRLDFSAQMRERFSGKSVLFHHLFCVSLSGCPNACSRPQIADFGFVGHIEPLVETEEGTGCGDCVSACLKGAISREGGIPAMNREKCLLSLRALSSRSDPRMKENP